MDSTPHAPDSKTRALTVLWPAFLMAGVLEMLVFALVDPHQLHGWGIDSADWPAGAVYTIAFLLFWCVIAAAAAAAVWLGQGGESAAHPSDD
jgi:hypothetical protein